MENPLKFKNTYRKRVKRLIEIMEEKEASLYLVTNPANIRYLCCHTFPKEPPLTHLLITEDGEMIGITSSLEGFRAREMAAVDEVKTFCTYPGLKCDYRSGVEGVRDYIKKLSPKVMLTDGRFLSRRTKVMKDSTITEMRKIKSREELEAMKKAAAVADSGYRFLKEFIRPGLTELDIVRELNHHLRSQKGVSNFAFETIIASGPHAAYSHHDPTDRVVKKGDAVICDFGVVVGGYCSDMTRTFLVGEVEEKLREIYDLVQRAQHESEGKVKVGEKLNVLDLTPRRLFEKEGYGQYYPHSVGHGLGLEVHEEPLGIRPNTKGEQKEGMVITIEPGIYIPGLGGVRIEDDFLITNKGAVRLTHAEQDPYV
ncbi:MAG: aminopeptidase P family protein [Thermoplasmata archaeon]|nr:aminopeptidase P family protein [Thermoplasmata archaeon]